MCVIFKMLAHLLLANQALKWLILRIFLAKSEPTCLEWSLHARLEWVSDYMSLMMLCFYITESNYLCPILLWDLVNRVQWVNFKDFFWQSPSLHVLSGARMRGRSEFLTVGVYRCYVSTLLKANISALSYSGVLWIELKGLTSHVLKIELNRFLSSF